MAEIDQWANASNAGPYTPATSSKDVPTQGPRTVGGQLKPAPMEVFPHSTPKTTATIHTVVGGSNGGPTSVESSGIISGRNGAKTTTPRSGRYIK